MSKVVVTYETGRVWSCEVDAVGDGDAGGICAAAGSVELAGRGLVFEPRVLPWDTGKWRAPTGVTSEYTASTPDYYEREGKRHEYNDGSMRSTRYSDKAEYAYARYVLLTNGELDGAVSVTVDGTLTYVRENGMLVSAVTDGTGTDRYGGMAEDFAVSNRPAPRETMAGMAHDLPRGIEFEPERW